jgi:hypothetical protein
LTEAAAAASAGVFPQRSGNGFWEIFEDNFFGNEFRSRSVAGTVVV